MCRKAQGQGQHPFQRRRQNWGPQNTRPGQRHTSVSTQIQKHTSHAPVTGQPASQTPVTGQPASQTPVTGQNTSQNQVLGQALIQKPRQTGQGDRRAPLSIQDSTEDQGQAASQTQERRLVPRASTQRRTPRMNDVNMPSGTKVSIVTPIQKVLNCCLWSKFRAIEKKIANEAGYVNERMLFHGSSAADDIVKTGFDLNKAKSGQFGRGVYFAKHSSKSNQYSPGYLGQRQMLLCRVALGRMHKRTTPDVTATPIGHHSVEGMLAVPEYVIYNINQAYPEYLVYYDISN